MKPSGRSLQMYLINLSKLSVTDKIWGLILDTILKIVALISEDACKLLSSLIKGNPKIHKMYNLMSPDEFIFTSETLVIYKKTKL